MSRRTSRAVFGILTLILVVALVTYFCQPRAGMKSAKSVANASNARNDKQPSPLMAIGSTETPATQPADARLGAALSGQATAIRTEAPIAGGSAGLTAGQPATRPAAAPQVSAAAHAVVEAPAASSNTVVSADANDRWAPLLSGANVPAATVAASVSLNPLADGKARIDAGELLAGRKILNDALNAGTLSAADSASAESLIANANKTIVFDAHRFPEDPYGGVYLVKPGENLTKIAARQGVTAAFLCRINGLSDARKLRSGVDIKIVQGPFHCVVTKSKFTMDLYLGGLPGEKSAMYVTSFPVGLGKDDSTPTGAWMVEPHRKLANPTYYSPRGEGVIAAGDPKNPLGKFWIGLAGTDGQAVGKTSYGIHGNIDPASIGKQSSMGCIRMRNEDIAVVYEMLVEGKSNVIVKN